MFFPHYLVLSFTGPLSYSAAVFFFFLLVLFSDLLASQPHPAHPSGSSTWPESSFLEEILEILDTELGRGTSWPLLGARSLCWWLMGRQESPRTESSDSELGLCWKVPLPSSSFMTMESLFTFLYLLCKMEIKIALSSLLFGGTKEIGGAKQLPVGQVLQKQWLSLWHRIFSCF